MTEPAVRFFLTRRAAIDLRSIHARSRREWGEDAADRYIAGLYTVLRKTTENPETGRLRQYRSAPFLMVPAQCHFVIYDLIPQGIVALTIQHQVRDIETLIVELTPNFLAEVERSKRRT
jgi:plasmid stabilization system protein ParE